MYDEINDSVIHQGELLSPIQASIDFPPDFEASMKTK